MKTCLLAAMLTVGASVAMPAELDLLWTVREAGQLVSPGRQFRTPADGRKLEGDFTATVALAPAGRGQRCDVTILDTRGAEREIVIDSILHLAGDFTHVFVTDGNGARPLADRGSAAYRDALSLPAITVYGPDSGCTVAAAFEVPAPALTFSWRRLPDGVEITTSVSHLRLPPRGEARAGLLVARHEGCWRPGLGWLVERYPEYFDPPNPRVWDYDGPMIYDFITDEARLRRDLTQDLSWQEVGWYWPHLGLYLPEGDRWQRQPGSEGGLGQGGTVTRQMLKDYLALARRLGIAPCLYFQSTESWAEYAQRNFPECRVQAADGKFAPTWIKCVIMDPDPRGRFGQHILDQARKLADTFPEMDGVFWDQNCYTSFDFAHDDGISMVNGRRVSMMEFPQVEILSQAGKLLHDRGKLIFTNGGWTAGLARYCDGHMSEGSGPTRRLQYLCMKKHLTLLSYDANLQTSREKLLLALETGAQPAVTLGDDSCRALFEGYKPIFRELRQKKWVFSPRALSLPDGVRGNMFRTREANYLVTAIVDETRPVKLAQVEDPLTMEVRLPDASDIGAVFTFDPGLLGLQPVRAEPQAGGWSLAIPQPRSGAAVLLARRGRFVASGTKRLLAGQRQPLSVQLANLTDRPWGGVWRFAIGEQMVERSLKLGPFERAQAALGEVAAGNDETPLTIRVTSPPGSEPAETAVQVPVVAPLAVHLASEGTVQALRGAEIEYGLSNRTAESVRVSVQVVPDGGIGNQPKLLDLKPGETRILSEPIDLEGGLHELRFCV
ncbi:MAG: hypothetical protein HUU20_07370, partial [Pirellulales bacterium]|nr:hypothetical protein [Pirellulales bacterium]